MILVTGAAGKTGMAVIRALVQRNQDVRALVRRPEQSRVMFELGASQAVDGDLGDSAVVEYAIDGVDAVYHICPNVDPLENEYADLLINAAVSAKVRQFGYHSVLHPQTEQMVHHWKKMRVEEKLFESGLAFTIMQPCAYMQNLLAQRDSIIGDGLFSVPYSTEAKISLVDLNDVAAAIAATFCDPGHLRAIYELAGPEPLNHVQIAAILSRLLNKPVRTVQVELGEWTSRARRAGMGDYAINALRSMFAYYDSYGFQGNSNALASLLGRRPNNLEAFLRDHLLDT